MSADFSTIADDYFCNFNLQTTLALPDSRDTVLHFCETIQKQFPDMGAFFQRDGGEYALEGARESGCYRWMELAKNSLSAGFFNPPSIDDACMFHSWLLERSRYYLGVSSIDIEAIDIVMGFNLDFCGNRDNLVMDTLLGGSALGGIASDSSFNKCVECEPTMVIALDESCSLQARIALETRNSGFQMRTGIYEDEPISIYFTIRQYAQPGKPIDLTTTIDHQKNVCEDLARRIVVPQIIEPLALAIASAS